jgi:hypothetical protein
MGFRTRQKSYIGFVHYDGEWGELMRRIHIVCILAVSYCSPFITSFTCDEIIMPLETEQQSLILEAKAESNSYPRIIYSIANPWSVPTDMREPFPFQVLFLSALLLHRIMNCYRRHAVLPVAPF